MKTTKNQLIAYAIILLAGLILGWLIFGGSHTGNEQLSDDEMEEHVMDEHTDEEGDIVYTCSMHPSVREDEPGNCPICGMDLIPASQAGEQAETDEYSMVMTQASMELADIQTTGAIRGIPEKEIHLPGRITVDERRMSYVTAHFEGRIRNVRIDFTGAPIREGDVMATVYSPELVSAQRELIEAARTRERNPNLYESAVRKFRLWEFTDEQIQAIVDRGEVKTDLEILSPVDGYVMKRNVVDQQHVSEGSVIYEVAPIDNLWVMLEAYEEDYAWIQTGDTIRFSTRSQPSRELVATVDFIDPMFNPESRTIGIRADIDNAGRELRPEMLVHATLNASIEGEEKVMVPLSSVLWTGPRSLVYVKDESAESPRFEVRQIDLGLRAGDYYVIDDGVEEGEEVVFNGAFRVDSEFQLADKFSMMNREPGSGSAPGGHQHGSMDSGETDTEDHSGHQAGEPSGMDESEASDEFREEFTELLEIYLSLKEDLFESDTEGAAESAEQFVSTLEEIGEHRLEGDAHMAWMESYSALMEHAMAMAEATDIEEYRGVFSRLSERLIEDVKAFGIEGVVYHQYCPMEEASWLSSEEQIQNPYSPDSMPSCGEVIERIE